MARSCEPRSPGARPKLSELAGRGPVGCQQAFVCVERTEPFFRLGWAAQPKVAVLPG
jgi:hypothetical protein